MLLDKILDSKNKLRLLRELCLHDNWEYSVNELSENTKIHRVLLSSLIKKLSKLGVIKVRSKGKVNLVRINKENLFVRKIIIDLFKKEKELPINVCKNLVNKLKKDKNIISILLYGSLIKGTFSLTSDIDLVIITKKEVSKKAKEEFEELLDKEINKLFDQLLTEGVLITPNVMSLSEFKALYKMNDPVIRDIVKKHELLYGKNILELV